MWLRAVAPVVLLGIPVGCGGSPVADPPEVVPISPSSSSSSPATSTSTSTSRAASATPSGQAPEETGSPGETKQRTPPTERRTPPASPKKDQPTQPPSPPPWVLPGPARTSIEERIGAPFDGQRPLIEALLRENCPQHDVCVQLVVRVSDPPVETGADCAIREVTMPDPLHEDDTITFKVDNPCDPDTE
jgi:hypothetical protein